MQIFLEYIQFCFVFFSIVYCFCIFCFCCSSLNLL